MTSTHDGTRHMQISEGGILHPAERSEVRGRSLYVHIQRVSITIENAPEGNLLSVSHTIPRADISIHNGIHVRITLCIKHQLYKPFPVFASAQHMVRYAINQHRLVVLISTPHLPRHGSHQHSEQHRHQTEQMNSQKTARFAVHPCLFVVFHNYFTFFLVANIRQSF